MSSWTKFVEVYINIYNTNSVLLIHHVQYISSNRYADINIFYMAGLQRTGSMTRVLGQPTSKATNNTLDFK
jgi:hypothetical protein